MDTLEWFIDAYCIRVNSTHHKGVSPVDDPSIIVFMGTDHRICDILIEHNDVYYDIYIRPGFVELWAHDMAEGGNFNIAHYAELAEFIDREYPTLTIDLAYAIAEEMKIIINKLFDSSAIISGVLSKLKRKSARE